MAAMICPSVAVSLALEELDRMKAMECLPEPEALLLRLQPLRKPKSRQVV